jgi:signal transduction histidine kinase
MNELNEVVHELNNVLTGILVSSGLLEQRLDPDSPLRRYAAGIREGGESGVKLIRELQAQDSMCRRNALMMPRKSRRKREGANADHRDQ